VSTPSSCTGIFTGWPTIARAVMFTGLGAVLASSLTGVTVILTVPEATFPSESRTV
jgi:hypothetical protein